MSLTVRKALEALSPATREFIRRVEEIHARADLTEEQKILGQTLLAQTLMPEQRTEIAAQAMNIATAIKFHDKTLGNRKQRRAMRKRASKE